MQPLTSIHVRTETLLLTKVEVWWYLVVKLGPNLSSNFDLVIPPPPIWWLPKNVYNVLVDEQCLFLLRFLFLCSSAPLDLIPRLFQAPLREPSVKMAPSHLVHLHHPSSLYHHFSLVTWDRVLITCSVISLGFFFFGSFCCVYRSPFHYSSCICVQ